MRGKKERAAQEEDKNNENDVYFHLEKEDDKGEENKKANAIGNS